MRLLSLFGAMAGMAVAVTSAMGATVVVVPATADLYAAGRSSGSCCGGDPLPAESPVLAPLTLVAGEYLNFSASGGASHAPAQPASSTADGDTSYTFNLTADYGTGISGPTNVHLNGLAGVFLGPATPSGSAPAQLTGTTFGSISPGLDQIFFVGDGLTGTGSGDIQTFYVPAGATRLYLGITDDGGYYDNFGSITATISVSDAMSAVPEPSTWAMMMLGFCGIGAMTHRRRKSATLAA